MWKFFYHLRKCNCRCTALLLFLQLALACSAARLCRGAGSLGVNYGKVANNLPPPAEVVTLIQSMGAVRKSKLYDADPTVLRTFRNTGIEFTIGAGNEELARLSNAALAAAWVQENVLAYMPATRIMGIVVGNEVLDGGSGGDPVLMALLLPAMENVYMALRTFGLHHDVYVSTAHSFATIAASFPPSAGAFHPSIAHLYMAPILRFLHLTGAPFLINVYPFFAYKADPSSVSLDYVLFRPNPGCRDDATGLMYYNMFDAQVDAVRSAMAALGFGNVTLLVSETGWPSAGDADEPGASVGNAQVYHANLVRHVASGLGTPLYPAATPDVFLFALFNEDMKPGPTSERNYGLFKPDGDNALAPLPNASNPSPTTVVALNGRSSILHKWMPSFRFPFPLRCAVVRTLVLFIYRTTFQMRPLKRNALLKTYHAITRSSYIAKDTKPNHKNK